MSKAFTKETDPADFEGDDEFDGVPALPVGTKNYITPAGYAMLARELGELWEVERPKLVETVAWAASNGDRSENGDYLYGKKRLREVDRRVRFLRKRLEAAEIVDAGAQQNRDQVFFGATVTYADAKGTARTITIVGMDEVDPTNGKVSWISPVARALLKAHEGDTVFMQAPHGREAIELLEIRYP